MSRFKSIIFILVLSSCSSPMEEHVKPERDHVVDLVCTTDSILSYADEKIIKIKQNQVQQQIFVDSLQHTIEEEQFTINDLNREVERRRNVDANLQLTKEELENALKKCREKEEELESLKERCALQGEKFLDEIEYYVDREIKLVTSYSHKVDSLTKIIRSMNQIPNTTNTNKKKNRRKR